MNSLPSQFEDLKKYKREAVELMNKKVHELEHRCKDAEVSVNELRSNNDNDHIAMKTTMDKYESSVTRGKNPYTVRL